MTVNPLTLGVPWSADIGSKRRVRRVKDIARIVNGFPFDSSKFDVDGEHPLIRIRDLSSTTTETSYSGDWVDAAAVEKGDVLIGMDGDFNVGTWKGGPALLNQRMCSVKGRSVAMSRYLAYALPRALQVTNDLTYYTTVKHLSSLDVERITVPVPLDEELDTILNFLDDKTARIDALIAEKERLLTLLAESRESVTELAVMPTNGARQKPLKRVTVRIITGPFGSALHSSEYVEGGVPVINPSHIVGGTVCPDQNVSVTPEMADSLSSYWLSPGELVVGRRGEMGRCAVVPLEGKGWLCGTGSLLATPDTSQVLPDYLQLVVSSRAARDWLSLESVGSTMENLNGEILGRLPGFFPPISDQAERLTRARAALVTHDDLIAHVLQHIARLREYRSSLISAAVTGQLEVGAFKEAA